LSTPTAATPTLVPERRSCCICGSPALRRFSAHASDTRDRAPVAIVECRSCAFAWQYPVGRTEHESVAWFDAAYEGNDPTKSGYFSTEGKREIAQLELEFVNGLPTPGRSLLDIGAGSGVFAMQAVDSGWSVTAIDPALDAVRLPRSDRLRVLRGTLDDIRIDERFDVITLWDVIEHATSPAELVADATRRLDDDGWIVVETGNYKSAARVTGGIDHWIYQLDHRWYFSPDSLRLLLEELGFREFVLSDRVLRPGWNGSVRFSGPSRRNLLKAAIRDPLRAGSHWLQYRRLRTASTWNASGLEIFTLAARRR